MSQPRLLDEVRTTARLRHLSLKTEKAYVQQIKRFILFHGKKHPREMNEHHIRDYLSHLAVERKVAASTQNVALAAILFLYRDVLKQKLERIEEVERARLSRHLPSADPSRSNHRSPQPKRCTLFSGRTDVWIRFAVNGMPAPESEGPRLRLRTNHRSQR